MSKSLKNIQLQSSLKRPLYLNKTVGGKHICDNIIAGALENWLDLC